MESSSDSTLGDTPLHTINRNCQSLEDNSKLWEGVQESKSPVNNKDEWVVVARSKHNFNPHMLGNPSISHPVMESKSVSCVGDVNQAQPTILRSSDVMPQLVKSEAVSSSPDFIEANESQCEDARPPPKVLETYHENTGTIKGYSGSYPQEDPLDSNETPDESPDQELPRREKTEDGSPNNIVHKPQATHKQFDSSNSTVPDGPPKQKHQCRMINDDGSPCTRSFV